MFGLCMSGEYMLEAIALMLYFMQADDDDSLQTLFPSMNTTKYLLITGDVPNGVVMHVGF